MRMNDPSVCHRLRPSHPPVKIILMNKKNSPHPTRASTHIRRYRRPPPPSDQIWEGGELPPLPLSPDLPPAGSRRDGNCRHRCRPSLASLRSDLGGRGTVAAAAAPGLPAGSGGGDHRRRRLPSLSGEREEGSAAAATSRPPPPFGRIWERGEGSRANPVASPLPPSTPQRLAVVGFRRSHHRC